MLRFIFSGIALFICSTLIAQPRVAVLPFDAVMDSTYRVFEGKESVLDYQNALQSVIFSEMSKVPDIRAIELSEISHIVKTLRASSERFNDVSLASSVCNDLNADFVVIGSFGEYSREIRIDARLYVAGMNEIAPGNAVSATTGLWEDLPSAAERVSVKLVSLIRESGPARPISRGRLYPEGDLESYGIGSSANTDLARLVVWVNVPSPKISATPAVEFQRCEPIDRVNVTAEKQRVSSCHFSWVKSKRIRVRIEHRGFLPYEQDLNLVDGKVYRLEVNLVEARYNGR